MNNKELNDKAISIKGKKYILVSDRIKFFNELYPNGCIQTEIISPLEAQTVVVKAKVIPDVKNPERYFIDYSQASWDDKHSLVNKTSALENASTSAVGRALAYCGIGIIDSIASVDEIKKASFPTSYSKSSTMKPQQSTDTIPVTDAGTKTCSICKKLHGGQFLKCIECWKKDKEPFQS